MTYQVHRHKTEPRRFFIYEQYKDDAALEAHRAAPHFLQYAKKELPKIGERVEGHLYEPLGEGRARTTFAGEARLGWGVVTREKETCSKRAVSSVLEP